MRDRNGFTHGYEYDCLGVRQDAGVAPHMLLDLREFGRRINRHRDAACKQDAEVGIKIVRRCGQHDRHCLPWLHAASLQASGDARGAGLESSISNFFLTVIRDNDDVRAITVRGDVPTERRRQGCGVDRLDARAFHACKSDARVGLRCWPGCRAGRCERHQQIARRLRDLQGVFGQRDAERALDAR